MSACGARSELGAPVHADAAVVDAAIAPEACTAIDYGVADMSATPIAIDDGFVYYAPGPYGEAIERIAKSGGKPEFVLKGDPNWDIQGALVVDDSALYWMGSQGKLSRATKDGATIDAFGCIAPSCGGGTLLAGNAAMLIVTLGNGVFDAVSKTTGLVMYALAPDAAPTGVVRASAIDDARFYLSTDERAYAIDLTNASAPVLQYGDWPTGLAIDDARVYWTTTSTIESASKANTSPMSISATLHAPLAAHGSFVYGLTSAGVVKIPATGGTPEVIAPGLKPTQLTIDGACLYMAAANGFLKRIPN